MRKVFQPQILPRLKIFAKQSLFMAHICENTGFLSLVQGAAYESHLHKESTCTHIYQASLALQGQHNKKGQVDLI